MTSVSEVVAARGDARAARRVWMGLSQAQLATRSGLSRGTVRRAEDGLDPTVRASISLAHVLHWTLGQFVEPDVRPLAVSPEPSQDNRTDSP